MGPSPTPALNEIRRIACISDPVRRNLEITHCYYRLSLAFTSATGACANWCTFAAWASNQAGVSIRGEDLVEAITRNTLTGSVFAHPIRASWDWLVRRGLLNPNSRLGRLANEVHSPFDAVERASSAVARGNLKVFEEIAPYFALALESKPLPPGSPDLLRSAFAHYAAGKPQTIFMANIEIGLHEQTRLQPEIQAAMEAGPSTGEDLGRHALQAIYPGAWNWPAFVRRPFAAALAPMARAFSRRVRQLTRVMTTHVLMRLTVPDTTIALGREIDRTPCAALKDITDPDLAALLKRFETAQGADWADLQYRMHVISRLFRVYHQSDELLQCPLSRAQLATLNR